MSIVAIGYTILLAIDPIAKPGVAYFAVSPPSLIAASLAPSLMAFSGLPLRYWCGSLHLQHYHLVRQQRRPGVQARDGDGNDVHPRKLGRNHLVAVSPFRTWFAESTQADVFCSVYFKEDKPRYHRGHGTGLAFACMAIVFVRSPSPSLPL